jgi:signal transduction histidine kinase
VSIAKKISGTGEMANLIRSLDWNKTVLGPISEWSATLLTSVNTMLASHFAGITFWGPDMLQFYNDAAIPLLTERHPRDLGVPASESWKESWDLLEPRLRDVFTNGNTFSEENGLVPVIRNGQMQDVYWTYSYSPIYEPTGEIAGIAVIFQDNTERTLAEQERDELAEQLRQVLDATTDAVVTVNRDWVITFTNVKGRQIYTQDGEIVGRVVWEAFPDAIYAGSPFTEYYYRAMNEGVAGGFEAYYPAPVDAWLHIMVYPTKDGIVTFSRDITARRKSEAALLQSEKLAAVGRLASSIAHEINNPLEAVMNVIYLAGSSETIDQVQAYLQTAEAELRRVAEITSHTLKFHKQSSNPTAVTSQDLFRSVLSLYRGRLTNFGISVELRDRSLEPILCFEGEIRQVVSNLIGNAIDASPGGHLFLRSREGTRWASGESGVILTVADTGRGMSREVLRRAFEPFFSTKGMAGTGLGLWVSLEIVMRHHGSLTVRSRTTEGLSGTVLRLFLPSNAIDR